MAVVRNYFKAFPDSVIWDTFAESFRRGHAPGFYFSRNRDYISGKRTHQEIQGFLKQIINGRNLDIGSGWHDYIKNGQNTCLDGSEKSLKLNPSSHKTLFDLEQLSDTTRLPFDDNSFDSATMVSVWQYLSGDTPKRLLRELERVLVPDSSLYLVQVVDFNVSGLEKRDPNHLKILEEIESFGYKPEINWVLNSNGIIYIKVPMLRQTGN